MAQKPEIPSVDIINPVTTIIFEVSLCLPLCIKFWVDLLQMELI